MSFTTEAPGALRSLATTQPDSPAAPPPSGSIGNLSNGGGTTTQPAGDQGLGTPAGTQQGPTGSFMPFIFLMLGIMVLMIVMGGRREKKERQKKEALLSSLKKNDQVRTVGGLLGNVVEVRPDEVVLKVDDSNNVKMRFAKSAVQEVVRSGPGGGGSDS